MYKIIVKLLLLSCLALPLLAQDKPAQKAKIIEKNNPNKYPVSKKKSDMVLEKNTLYIFGNESCGRTFTVRKKLDEDQLKYTFVNLANDQGKTSDLFSLLRKSGYTSKKVMYPVSFYNEVCLIPAKEKHFKGLVFNRQSYLDDLKLLLENKLKSANDTGKNEEKKENKPDKKPLNPNQPKKVK